MHLQREVSQYTQIAEVPTAARCVQNISMNGKSEMVHGLFGPPSKSTSNDKTKFDKKLELETGTGLCCGIVTRPRGHWHIDPPVEQALEQTMIVCTAGGHGYMPYTHTMILKQATVAMTSWCPRQTAMSSGGKCVHRAYTSQRYKLQHTLRWALQSPAM